MQVNTAGRYAAVSPGSSDSLADFAGTYATHLLPAEQKEQVTQGCEITIKVNAQGGFPSTIPSGNHCSCRNRPKRHE